MANKEFNNIEEFIEGFTRTGPTPENYTYDGVIWWMEFQYKNRIFTKNKRASWFECQLFC